MKKFKSILALTASVLALSAFAAPVSAFAAGSDTYTWNKDGENNFSYNSSTWQSNDNVAFTYAVNPTFTVTIPADVTFTSTTKSVTDGEVKATDCLLEDGYTLTVSATYSGLLKLNTDDNTTLAYTAKIADSVDGLGNAAALTTGSAQTILTVSSGATEGSTKIGFYLGDGAPTKAGTYSDTMTFTIAYATAG